MRLKDVQALASGVVYRMSFIGFSLLVVVIGFLVLPTMKLKVCRAGSGDLSKMQPTQIK
jgi:uncharacterized membrane protein